MKLHILLIDDDKDELTFFLDALKNVPTNDGFKCTYASSARQALEMMQFFVPDFVFVDYHMPVVTGLQFLSSLRDKPGIEKPKIYLYSIYTNEKITKAALEMGAAGALRKEYTIRAMSQVLAAVLTFPEMAT